MIDTPKITQTTAQLTAVIPLTIPKDQIQEVMGPGISELMSTIAAQGIQLAGPWFNHHLKIDPELWEFEISVPVSKPIKASGRVKPGALPAMKVARTIYQGPYEGLGSAWEKFNSWIKAKGHTPRVNLWECYLTGPESGSDSTKWRTELNRPLVD